MQLLGPQNCQDKENDNYKELSWSHAHSSAHKYSYKRKQCNGFPWTSGSQFKANPVGDWGLKIGCIAKSFHYFKTSFGLKYAVIITTHACSLLNNLQPSNHKRELGFLLIQINVQYTLSILHVTDLLSRNLVLYLFRSLFYHVLCTMFKII